MIYPPNKLIDTTYRQANGIYAFGPFLFLFFVVIPFIILNFKWACIFSIESLLLTYFVDKLHTHYHLEGSFLEKYEFFRNWRGKI